MVKRTLPTNPKTRRVIKLLRKASMAHGAECWRALSDALSAPSRSAVAINLGRIDKLADEGDFVAVPGKILGFGTLSKRVDVAALSFSQNAKEKILESGGRAVSLEVLLNINPKGRSVKILK